MITHLDLHSGIGAEVPDLSRYHIILINSSAGKDSQAMLTYVVRLADQQGIPRSRIVVVYASLGRVVHPGTLELARAQAEAYGLRFEVVKREEDLLDQIAARRRRLDTESEELAADAFRRLIEGDYEGAAEAASKAAKKWDTPAWPSSTARYCTSDQKVAQILKLITRLVDEARAAGVTGQVLVLNCLGIRAEESPARAKKVAFGPDSASNGKRMVDRWLPIFDWTVGQVWETILRSGLPYHPAYDAGLPRLSCVFCLAPETEVATRNGIRTIAALAGGSHELLVPKVTPFGLSGDGTFQEVEVRSFGVQRLMRVVLARGRQRKTVYATAEHRWLVQQRRPKWKADGRHGGYDPTTTERLTAALESGDRLRSIHAQQSGRTGQVRFAVAQGFVFGDGTKGCGDRPATLTIYNDAKDGALLPYFAGHEIRVVTANGKPALRIYGLPRMWKEVPDLRESRAFLLSWLAGYFAADGTVTPDGSARFSSARREHLEFVRSVAAICGVGYGPIMTASRIGLGKEPSDLHTLTLDATTVPDWFFLIDAHRTRVEAKAGLRETHERMWRVQSVEDTDRVEEVFCAVVPGAHAFALSDGLMTGNCVLAGRKELVLAAKLYPELAFEYLALEREVRHTFRKGLSMADIIAEAGIQPPPEPALVWGA